MLRRLCMHWPLHVLVILYAASVLLFCTSMLSTSTVMRDIATEPCPNTVATPVDQVVLILIDAMRPDFVLERLRPFARTGGECDVHGDTSLKTIWAENRYTGPTLHYMEESLRSETDASLAYFLVADAPTTTAQRIKAIATGTMPAFLEAGSNFNSEATELDSIIGQMNGSAVLLGDDTWEKLFPNTPTKRHWKHAVGIPSFDVADFHTNDDAVLKEIYTVLHRETPEAVRAAATAAAPTPPSSNTSPQTAGQHAGLVVAHFLGVDHVGHRIDADNPFMKGKLLQLDEMLRNVSQLLQERPTTLNTMLLVMGDHGMTNSGDHGGGSAQETDTFLFARYFPGAASPAAPASPSGSADMDGVEFDRAMTATTTTNSSFSPAANVRRARRLMRQRWHNRVDVELDRLRSCRDAAGVLPDKLGASYQVDVTATIAVLLGRPIPYSSFGRVMPEVLALANATTDVAAVERCNLQQLQRYFRESRMKIPRDASWLPPRNTSVTQQLADMSYYARRTRTDMRRTGMFVGSTGLLLCAMSLLWSPAIRGYFTLRCSGWVMRWTVLVLVLRLCIVFSNSFVVNEDAEVLGLLCSSLLFLWVPRVMAAVKVMRRSIDHPPVSSKKASARNSAMTLSRLAQAMRHKQAAFVVLLLLGLRLTVPVLLRHRAHVTHTVETASAADRFVARHASFHVERLGIFTVAVLWTALYRGMVPLPVVAGTTVCVASVYHVPVVHHVVPLLCGALYPYLARVSFHRFPAPVQGSLARWYLPYRYFVLVLWLSSLCNGKVATAVVVALYGATLPRLCSVLRGEPLLTQATVLHLFAFVGFFAEGHQCMLNTIDWNASFVGMPYYNMYVGGMLVLSRTFHAFLLVPLALYVAPHTGGNGIHSLTSEELITAKAKREKGDALVGSQAESTRQEDSEYFGIVMGEYGLDTPVVAVMVVVALYLYLLVVQSAVSCFSGYIQKSHLMFYPIFCPKLLFDAVIALLSCIVVLICFVFFQPT